MVRDLDLWAPHGMTTADWRLLPDGLPLHGGAQLAIDTTLVSALTRDGTAREQETERAHVPRIVW